MLSYADIVDWFVEFLFGCMSETINFKQLKRNKKTTTATPLFRLWDPSISWFQMGLLSIWIFVWKQKTKLFIFMHMKE